jgi:hypothetical protein
MIEITSNLLGQQKTSIYVDDKLFYVVEEHATEGRQSIQATI